MSELYRYLLTLLVFFCASCSKEKYDINYEIIELNTTTDLRSINFINENIGFIGGGKKYDIGLIWSTINGGTTWQADTIDAQAIHDIKFYKQQPILGTTTGRFFFRNNENNWYYSQTSHPEYGWKPLFAVAQTTDSNLLAISGEGYYWGSIIRSENGGETWEYYTSEHQFFDLEMVTSTIGFACGFGAVYKTEDGGKNWQILDLKGDIFKSMCFLTPQLGYIIGDEGSILKTEDGGISFQEIRKPNHFWNKRLHWNDVQFLNENEGWIIGENAVWRTQNGGETWEILDNLPQCNYRSIYLFNYQKAILVGDSGCVVAI